MASVFKRKRDRTNKLASWFIAYQDENGKRRMAKGCPDKAATEALARKLESEAALRRRGVIDPKAESYRDHEARPLAEHLDAWRQSMAAKDSTAKHVELFSTRAARVVALLKGADLSEIEPARTATKADVARVEANRSKWVATARLSDLTAERVQKALATLKAAGRSLQTCNHHRAAIKAFSAWCHDTHRIREDAVRGVAGFNAKEDRRHDRRTLSLDDLRRLIEAAERGPVVMGMPGPARAICYRLAVATGLRFSELASLTPASFDWDAPSVTIKAAYAKNGQTITLPLPDDVASDLAAFVAPLAPSMPVFSLPDEKGAKMLRPDLQAAGIPYRDASGLVFDFHSLRCETATLADAAGISPRVVQRLMRHSTLELTGRYTRPRAVDIEAAASMLPTLKPEGDRPEAMAATGTDAATPDRHDLAAHWQRAGCGSGRFESVSDVIAASTVQKSMGENPLKNRGLDGSSRLESAAVGSTGVRTRTGDLRIMRPPL